MEQILPGVSVAIRPEGLITPGVVSISTIGMVGTASKGPVGKPVTIGSPADAREIFGEADAVTTPPGQELTLIRALDLAFDHGARDVIAVRVANGENPATYPVLDDSGPPNVLFNLVARSSGTWGNDLSINIAAATENALISGETQLGVDLPSTISLHRAPLIESAQNRISVLASGSTVPLNFDIVDTPPAAGQVQIDLTTGDLTFFAGEQPGASDRIKATYVVASANALQVTLRQGLDEEVYTIVDGQHLLDQIGESDDPGNASSALAMVQSQPPPAELKTAPDAFASPSEFRLFGGGTNGAASANYAEGFEALANERAFIIVAAGQDNRGSIGADLTAHVNSASSDANKQERIGIIGSEPEPDLDDILGHTLNSDRIVFVAPGVTVSDVVTGEPVTLSGGYAAAAVAGMISGAPINRSLTNKVLSVAGLEEDYSQAELRRLVQARVLALEKKLGFRTVKGITTSTNTAWHQITTRRIVDKAKIGVRSAANPYIGLLNNDRVRAAMRSTVNSFLAEMVLDEELVSYELEVSATRDDERRGIARVTIVLRPTFSIDFIKVTMFLE